MSSDANKRTVRDFFAALSSGDFPRMRELLHEDLTWTLIGDTPLSRTFHGIEGFETGLIANVVKQIDQKAGVQIDILDMIAEGDKVVVRAQGKVTGLHGPYNNTYCHVFTLRDGKIIEDFEYLDTLLIERALYGRKLVD